MVVLQIHELINVESYVDSELSVTHLESLTVDFELNGFQKSPANVALPEVECSQEL